MTSPPPPATATTPPSAADREDIGAPRPTRREMAAAGALLAAAPIPASGGEAEIRQAVQRYAAAWAAGDFPAIAACYHPDFTLIYFGRNALGGVHAGKPTALATLAEFTRRTRRRLVAILAVMAGPERGAILARERMSAAGAETEVDRLLVYEVQDGLLRTCAVYDGDQRFIDSLIGPPADPDPGEGD